ncbi:uncharacterized protein LOC135157524 [Lytechinus pictus]|uniref:uncharacterized protein LOC135157524 n=1 Tax=Lytechinus pictus TaxID=7653 RepID=UPI0030B9C6EE
MDPSNKPNSEALAGVGPGAGDDEDDVKSTTSRGSAMSRVSCVSDTSSVKLRAARVKEELVNKKREQFLQEQRLRREQFKLQQEQFELNERIELLKIDHDKENAKVEATMWQEQVNEERAEVGFPPLPNKDLDNVQITERWFSTRGESNHQGNVPNVQKDNVYVKGNEHVSTGVVGEGTTTIHKPGNEGVGLSRGYNGNHQVNSQAQEQKPFIPNPFQTPVNNMYNHSMMAMALSLPKPDMPTFSGNPIDYWNFVNSFEVNIADRIHDSRLKVSYLIQFTSDKAREAIENCVLLDPDTGYSRARIILQDQFGRNYIVARAHLKKVINRSPLRTTDSQGLWDLARDMRRCQMTTSQMGYSADMSTTDTLLKIQHLLPVHIQSKWASRAHSLMEQSVMPNFSHLTDFIEESAKVASNVFGKSVGRPAVQDKKASAGKPRPKVSTFNTTTSKSEKPKDSSSCPCCSEKHELDKCRKFKGQSVDERFAFVKSKGLCFNCLKGSHMAKGCTANPKCSKDGCKKRHHTLLHMEWSTKGKDKGQETGKQTGAGQGSDLDNQADTNAVGGQKEVCLRVLPVKVRGNGREVTTWALLDHGSDVSLCEHRLADDLRIQGKETNFRLTTVNNTNTQRGGQEVSFSIQGIKDRDVIDMPRVWTVESLPTTHRSIPRQQDVDRWSHLKGIELPTAAKKDITLLIGSDTPEAFWVQEERRGKKKEPYAIRSPLGWTVMGPTGRRRKGAFDVNNISSMDDHLQEQVQRFWKLDYAPGDESERLGDSVEDRKARAMMEDIIRLMDGHYEMGLPWRQFPPSLPNNHRMAESRLRSLKRRLEKDDSLHQKYTETMTNYLSKGFAREVDEDPQEEGSIWYLPHHPVTHPFKPEKVRVVFDCAAKYQGISLNSHLLSGPDYTNKLVGVLLRFRQEEIALVADVEGMFHQVRVTPTHTDALRFLWWENGNTDTTPKTYKMQVHLFGATSSPSCAGFALQRTEEDNRQDFEPEVCQIVKDNFYVDDCLKSVRSTEEAIRLIPQLCSLLRKGGFRLTKWVSNDKEVLETVPPTERAASVVDLDLDHLPIERTLGVLWNMDSDMFSFKVSPKDVPATRRGILSATSSLYDPLGFVAPFTVNAKLLLQDLCAQGLGWDEKIKDQDLQRWRAWLAELPELTSVHIPICFKPSDFKDPVYDLHVFCDASERAYAACAYLRIEDSGRTHSALVMGKTRLCPLKKMTVPRLELSAAVLAVKLGRTIMEELRISTCSLRKAATIIITSIN